jgi:hypothetical protein
MNEYQTLVVEITDKEAYDAVHPYKRQIAGAKVAAVSRGDQLEVCDEMYDRIEKYCDAKCDHPYDCEDCPLAAAKDKWDTWDGQTLIEPEPTSALTPATALQHRRKLLAVIVQGLIERGVITAEDVASVGGVR